MNSESIIDIDKLKKNCLEYAKSQKNIDVLKKANGKNHYTIIAEEMGMSETTVSGLLTKAKKLGLAEKLSNGNYKKRVGILSYMPKHKSRQKSRKSVSDLLKKITRTKKMGPHGFAPSNKTFNTISKMTDAYTSLYAVENTLRELIRTVLSKKQNWWKTYIPRGIQQDVLVTISKTPYHAAPRKDELDYTHLGQLKEIIVNKKNWNDFLPHLIEKDKNAFSATIDKAIPSRNAIGHCITLQQADIKVVDVRLQDILMMIKNMKN